MLHKLEVIDLPEGIVFGPFERSSTFPDPNSASAESEKYVDKRATVSYGVPAVPMKKRPQSKTAKEGNSLLIPVIGCIVLLIILMGCGVGIYCCLKQPKRSLPVERDIEEGFA